MIALLVSVLLIMLLFSAFCAVAWLIHGVIAELVG